MSCKHDARKRRRKRRIDFLEDRVGALVLECQSLRHALYDLANQIQAMKEPK